MDIKQLKQWMFDTALNHIRRQREASMAALTSIDNGRISRYQCAYRGEGKTMCTFGPFIENYNERMERNSAAMLICSFPEDIHPKLQFEGNHRILGFANALQSCHDSAAILPQCGSFMQDYERSMSLLADNEGLTYSS